MNTIKLLGIRDLKSDDKISANRDYGILLIASRISKEVPDSHTDEESEEVIYKLKVISVDAIYDLKDKKPVEFQHGKTPSQKLRFRIETILSKEEYEPMINYILSRLDELCDNYLEIIKKI